ALAAPRANVVEVDPLGLVCDWDGDGIDEVWGRDKAAIPGWFKWPAGPAVARIPQAIRVIGLFDVNNDGEAELLYFQGDSLVVHQRGK
ncbi:MAG: hypothetical protein PHU85_14630, partial [Phycisphaerae bacterium]|nr:hypothetical protein [Phycisphaerae bacterium]